MQKDFGTLSASEMLFYSEICSGDFTLAKNLNESILKEV